MQGSFKAMWADLPAYMELAKHVGIDVNAPTRRYGCDDLDSDRPGESIVDFASAPKDGLTIFCWEDHDEVHKDGVVLWKSENRRFYNSILAVVDGKVKHFSADNGLEVLGEFNDDVEPKCELCPNHGTELVSELVPTSKLMQYADRDDD